MTRIIGIVNLTRDSFSDGGHFLDPHAAIAHAEQLLADGADVVELGAESTHPNAEHVPAEEELTRLTPLIERLKSDGTSIAVDTTKPVVMRRALELGADYINDVTAFSTPAAIDAVRHSTAKLILMHATHASPAAKRTSLDQPGASTGRAERIDIAAEHIMPAICSFFSRRIVEICQTGIDRNRLILDPGMGFFLSTRAAASFETLSRIRELEAFGCPTLISVSRKSFIGEQLATAGVPRGVTQRGPGTLAAELWAASAGVSYIRTHDVRALRDALAIWNAIAERARVTVSSRER